MTKKNKILMIGTNVFALLMIIVLVFLMTSPRGSLEAEYTGVYAHNVTGDVSIRRNGSNYTLKDDETLFANDEILVSRDGSCEVIADGRARATMDGSARLMIRKLEDDLLSIEVTNGSVMFDLIRSTPESPVLINADKAVMTVETGAVFSVEGYVGTQTVNLYAGRSRIKWGSETLDVESGDHVTLYQSEDQDGMTLSDIHVSELSRFLLYELLSRNGLCFEEETLRAVIASRIGEHAQPAAADESGKMTCTVEIRCDTLLSRPDGLPEGLPADGVLLPPTPVSFTPGENGYDVLRRACKLSGIAMERTYLVMIGGYYITGLGGLNESAFGPSSGWLYRVNGWYPNYGPSKYAVNPGDVIVWAYSCDGGADDLGREKWELRSESISINEP